MTQKWNLLMRAPPEAKKIADAIVAAGGTPFIVGGWVRDQLLGLDSKDIDIEVYGLPLPQLEEVLGQFGEVDVVGRHFGVLKVHGYDFDISLPRKDSKAGKGHCGFKIEVDHTLKPEEAARRRDFTINSMSLNLKTGELVDPFNGQQDLAHRLLKATDQSHFGEDPLRALRAIQFAARFSMGIVGNTLRLCADQDLSELPGERIFEEFKKLLLKAPVPSFGLKYLEEMGHLKYFPEIEALVDCEQDPEWHPEGTVWQHTLMVVDEAAKLRMGDEEQDLVLMVAALCHDFGKPETTTYEINDEEVGRHIFWDYFYSGYTGRIRSREHEARGEQPTRNFLGRLRASNGFTEAVVALVKDHLVPALFPKQKAGPGAYRRLARRLEKAGTTVEMLYRLNQADHFGRNTPDAIAREHPAGEEFLKKATEIEVREEGPKDVVMGRHLINRGYHPNKWFGVVLDKCREYQFDTGETDPDVILDAVLSQVEK